jgi:antitoxin FitA
MTTTLTIRNLDEPVKQKLRIQAASHGRSMEAEARAILTRAMNGGSAETADDLPAPATVGAPARNKGKFDHVIGLWKGGMSTDEIMQLTRGE